MLFSLDYCPQNRKSNKQVIFDKDLEIYLRFPFRKKDFNTGGVSGDLVHAMSKAYFYEMFGPEEEAVPFFERATKLAPESATLWNDRGACLEHLGRFEEALSCFDKALRINPQFTLAWTNKSNTLRSLKRYKEADECSRKILNIAPQSATAWYEKAAVLSVTGQYLEAVDCYSKALELNPRLIEAWSNQGVCFEKLERFAEAVRCYSHALEINPCAADAWYNRGVSLSALGRFEDAIESYNKALSINPADADSLYNRARNELRLGRTKEAVATFQSFLEHASPAYESFKCVPNVRNQLNKLSGKNEVEDNLPIYLTEYRKKLAMCSGKEEEIKRLVSSIVKCNKCQKVFPVLGNVKISKDEILVTCPNCLFAAGVQQ